MSDVFDYLADVVAVIRADANLRQCFQRVLSLGSSTQQVRTSALLSELEKLGAPDAVKKFVRLLGNDKLAHQVLQMLND